VIFVFWCYVCVYIIVSQNNDNDDDDDDDDDDENVANDNNVGGESEAEGNADDDDAEEDAEQQPGNVDQREQQQPDKEPVKKDVPPTHLADNPYDPRVHEAAWVTAERRLGRDGLNIKAAKTAWTKANPKGTHVAGAHKQAPRKRSMSTSTAATVAKKGKK
jgi:hypothetical protein